MTMQQLLQFTKGSDSGCKAWRTRCYLQVPKTGSSTVKTMFGLPIVGTIRPKGLCSTVSGAVQPCAGTLPHCMQTLVTWREPFARFVSGIGTIHRRTQHWCVNSKRFAPESKVLCFRLGTPLAFARYAGVILDEIENIIYNCTPYREAGPQNLTPEFFHVLPQWIFLRLLPSPSAARIEPPQPLTTKPLISPP